MAAISSDSNIVAIAKTYYTDKKFEQLFARNDPFCRIVEKNRVGGKEYRFGTKVYQGGNVAGNYQQLLQNFGALSGGVAGTSGFGGISGINAEFVVTPGTIFTVFQVTQLETLATRTDRQAYVKATISKFFDATEGLRKAFATAAYGTGFGEVGQVNTGALFYTNAAWTGGTAGTAVDGINAFTAQPSVWLQLFQSDGTTKAWDILVKLSIGSIIQFVSGSAPSGAFVGAGTLYVVQAIQDNAIKLANAAGGNVPAEVLTVGNWIVLNGCSTTSNTVPLFPIGLGGWLPTLGTARQNNTAAWQTYIATSFFGVDRSQAPDRLAGSFYTLSGSEKRGDAIIEGVRMARRGGGVPNMVVVNDQDYRQILTDFNAQTQYMQQINTTPQKTSENDVQKGLMDMGFQFSSNWLQMVYDTPYCPWGTAYILDLDTIEFVGWSNAKTPIEDDIEGNNPGAELVDSIGDVDLNFKLLIEDYLNVVPGSPTVQGPAALVSLSLFGQFCFHNTAHCCVVRFV